jgi:hypothetical protein
MQSRLRSVSVATFAGTFWFLGHALADEAPGRAEPAHAPTAVSSAGPATPAAPARPEEERLSDEAELARVVGLVDAAKYEECVARLSRLLDPKSPHPLSNPQIIETARLYHATCLMGVGKDQQADAPLREAIRKNPQMRPPDSLVFPPRVVERFLKLREEYYKELRSAGQDLIDRAEREAKARQAREDAQRAYIQMLEHVAGKEVVVEKHSRYLALVPFGVGQFQNGNQALGWTFLGTEAALAVVSLTSVGVFSSIKNEADRYEARGQPPAQDVNGRLQNWHLAMTLSTYGMLGIAALGILEAQLSYVPEVRHVRDRPLPKPPKEQPAWLIEPDVAAGPHDVKIGVRGVF